ncbi:hypothetical protein YYC_04288 [Plasmodium yoelii 17X]|uniref:Uncharacterized protein n=1 Tax=Plasmodium yoelii 17X TaxID=1323249 RepID=V7PG87_PLAYE|nr:hypothetical protein YYC_04288 [Plasmodium yoelii 17X]
MENMHKICEKFQDVEEWFLGELDSNGGNKFKHPEYFQNYCINKCDTNFDKINAGCLYLLDQFYKHDGLFPSPSISNPNIVDNIFIWLSYMLSLDKTIQHDGIKYFYDNYIKQRNTYNTTISGLIGYDTYKDLIYERKYLLDMDSNIVSKFYQALKLLCNLYNELDYENKDCKKYLDDNSDFFKKYQKLEQDTSITENDSYNKLLSTLSTDYDGFKTECNHIISSLSAETKEKSGQDIDGLGQNIDGLGQNIDGLGQYVDGFEQNADNSDVASSSSSIVSKLIPVLLIFGAIPIFLGISYKVNNKELKNYFHYIYVNANKKIIRFLTFYISIRYLDFGNDFKNKN